MIIYHFIEPIQFIWYKLTDLKHKLVWILKRSRLIFHVGFKEKFKVPVNVVNHFFHFLVWALKHFVVEIDLRKSIFIFL